jgi:tRNA(His) 5'-end guanylyltransferase
VRPAKLKAWLWRRDEAWSNKRSSSRAWSLQQAARKFDVAEAVDRFRSRLQSNGKEG